MNQSIASYIEQQIEVAKAEQQRKLVEAQAEADRKAQEVKALSLQNTLRAFALMGIEAGESDLSYSEDNGYSLHFGHVSLSLDHESSGKNWLQEEPYNPNYQKRGQGEVPSLYIRFIVWVRREMPAELVSDEGEWPRAFIGSQLVHRHEIDTRLNEGVTRIAEAKLQGIYRSIPTVEANFQAAFAQHQQIIAAKGASSEVAAKPQSQFTYTGDSREEILAHVLRDIQADYYPEVEF
jgi:hypothetical protein